MGDLIDPGQLDTTGYSDILTKQDSAEWDDGLGDTVVIPEIFPTHAPNKKYNRVVPHWDERWSEEKVTEQIMNEDSQDLIFLPRIDGVLVAQQLLAGRFEPKSPQFLAALQVATREIAKNANREDPQSLRDCFDAYIYLCIHSGAIVTNLSAYAAMGVFGADIDHWASGAQRATDPRYRELAMYVKSVCADYREQAMVSGTINPIVGIWHQKIYEHYNDSVPTPAETGSALGQGIAPSLLAQKYADLMDEETGETDSVDAVNTED